MKEVWFYEIKGEPGYKIGPFESKEAAEAEWLSKKNNPSHYVNSRRFVREYGPPEATFIEKPGTA
jgi:hypothetical protein